jgi:hypothetical protein
MLSPSTMARICDPAGPRRWRAAAFVGLLPLAPLALGLPLPALPRAVMLLVGVAWLVVARIVVPRMRPRACAVTVEPGAIEVARAGLLNQRIRAMDVRAASAARFGSRFLLALVRHEERDPPLWLELDTAADLERVRRALGIGHAGHGELCFPPQRGMFHAMPSSVDAIAALGWTAMVIAACLQATEIALGLALLVVPLSLAAVVLAALPRGSPLTLTRHGVAAPGHGIHLRWTAVVDAWVQGQALVVRTPERCHRMPIRYGLPLEAEYVAAQIRSAAGRARGEGPPPPHVPPSLAILAPRDEAHRAWLERIDATAASLSHADGYRVAGVSPEELGTAIEDPDAPAPLRAAAARLLARIAPSEAGGCVARALARERDVSVSVRIRAALEEDVDLAARELDRLDRP